MADDMGLEELEDQVQARLQKYVGTMAVVPCACQPTMAECGAACHVPVPRAMDSVQWTVLCWCTCLTGPSAR